MISSVIDDDAVALRTVASAAKFLGVSESTIYELGKKGELEMVKVGRSTRVTQVSLEQYVRNAKRVTLARTPRRNRGKE